MNTEKKLTAVEWLFEQLLKGKFGMKKIIEQAKEKEKQQIIDAEDKMKEIINAYKECFELFIHTEKWDEATELTF